MNAPAHMHSQLPDWLTEDDDTPDRVEQQIRHELNSNQGFPAQGNQAVLIELEKQSFGIAFESALEALAGGTTLTEFCHNYHMPISPVRFRTWMLQDNRRKNAYYGAKALWAEALEDELIRISDGIGPDGQRGSPNAPSGPSLPEDVQRSTLRIATRKWIMEKSNRKRYGDVKHIEQTTTNTTTIDVTTMSTEDLKRFVLRQAGADSLDATTLDAALAADDQSGQP
jgi:hypothetical protein